MSAVGFKSGLAAFTDAGMLRSNCVFSVLETLSKPKLFVMPAISKPPWS